VFELLTADQKMGVFMKFTVLMTFMLVSQISLAQSLREKRIKQEMLDRSEELIEKIESARNDLENEDVVSACKTIRELFEKYPKHLVGIGTHLDLERPRTIKSKDRALEELIYFHQKTLICNQGKDSEYVDPEQMRKELKKIKRSLKKQKRVIKRSDTDNENSFYYEYRF
jgi:predicted nuclease with TOPRIM domain